MISAQKQTEFFHSDFDQLKKVRSIWICMDSNRTEDSIEEIRLDRKTVFGSKKNLIAMLEDLISEKSAEEKKRILTDEYGMIMTAELEGRIRIMCNWSECMEERIEKKVEKRSIERERRNAVRRMIQVNITKEQILSMGYTEAEYAEVEASMCVNP